MLYNTMRSLVLLALCAMPLGQVQAQQDYPNRPITLIVSFGAGSNTDIIMRTLAEAVRKDLGQPIVVENRPGASGMVAAGALANAKPDGYTIGFASVPMVRIPLIQKTPWDPLADFTYIANLMIYPLGVVAGAQTPWRTWEELVAYAKAHPGAVSYATPGQYSTPHMGMEAVSEAIGVEFLHVPYSGGTPANSAVAGGHVHLQANAPNWKPLLEAGSARLLVMWTAQRSPQWSDVPTLTELGTPLVIDTPLGIVGPKGMDPKTVARLDQAFRAALDTPQVKRIMVEQDMFLSYKGPADYRQYMADLQKQERAQLEKMGVPIVQ